MTTINLQEQFLNDGYILKENYLSSDTISSIKNHINSINPKIYDNFSKIPLPRGWGNLVDNKFLTHKVRLNELIRETGIITQKNMSCNLLVVNNKPKWIGRDFEFHQEVFNSSTFAAGADSNSVRDKWIQIYIALDDESSINGGLSIFEGSHKYGILDFEDFIDSNFRHKRRVSTSCLDKLEKNGCVLKSLNLKAGSLLIFSTFLVHASSTNMTSNNRMSLVLQLEPKSFKANTKQFEKEVKFRSGFIQSTLTTLLENEKSKDNAYADVGLKK